MSYRSFLLFTGLLLLTACRDDFSLEGPYQDLPTAVAYLNAEDDRHFVRVQKAFLEAGGNATEIAGIADSLYYGPGEATVLLDNLTTGQGTELERVDAEDFGRNRSEGLFATSPNVAYTVTDEVFPLTGGDEVRLIIRRPGEEDAVATTALIRPLEVRRPNETVSIEDYGRPLVMSWTKTPNAAVYDVRLLFNLRELFPANPDRNRDRVLEWIVSGAFVPGGDQVSDRLVRFDVSNEAIYQFLGAELRPEDGIVRRLTDFDLVVSAAGREVLDRRNLETANAGITSSQFLPRYTNLEGGIGLFTSNTSSVREGIQLTDGSQDSLENGVYTRELGFR